VNYAGTHHVTSPDRGGAVLPPAHFHFGRASPDRLVRQHRHPLAAPQFRSRLEYGFDLSIRPRALPHRIRLQMRPAPPNRAVSFMPSFPCR